MDCTGLSETFKLPSLENRAEQSLAVQSEVRVERIWHAYAACIRAKSELSMGLAWPLSVRDALELESRAGLIDS